MHDHLSAPPGRRPYLWATVLIGVPVIALLALPLYGHTGPTVLSFPLFYWWTFLWIVALSGGIGLAFRTLERAQPTGATAKRRTETGVNH